MRSSFSRLGIAPGLANTSVSSVVRIIRSAVVSRTELSNALPAQAPSLRAYEPVAIRSVARKKNENDRRQKVAFDDRQLVARDLCPEFFGIGELTRAVRSESGSGQQVRPKRHQRDDSDRRVSAHPAVAALSWPEVTPIRI
jgi:hypothetical protein